MPLIFEIQSEKKLGWIKLGLLKEGDRPASVSSRGKDGHRDIYLIRCAVGSSYVLRQSGGTDSLSPDRVIREVDADGFEFVRKILPGEEFQVNVQTDRMPESRLVRFRHVSTDQIGGRG